MACNRYGRRTALLLLSSAAVAESQTVLANTILFESTPLTAPVVVFAVRDAATEWRAGIAGWTLNGAWTRTLSPRRAVAVALEVTPVNAHLSNRRYTDGLLDPGLAYRNATAQLSGGMRWSRTSRWTTELRGVVLYERVEGLPTEVVDAWRAPFVGLDVVQRFDRITADDPLRWRFEGVRLAGRGQVFTGTSAWGTGTLTASTGARTGRFFLRANGTGFSGRSVNTVNAFLTSGSWDAAGPTAMYGHPHGAFRLDQAVLANAGADVRIWRTTEVGVRGAWLASRGDRHHGGAVTLSTLWRGMGLGVALAVPEDDAFRGRWDRAIVTGGVSAWFIR